MNLIRVITQESREDRIKRIVSEDIQAGLRGFIGKEITADNMQNLEHTVNRVIMNINSNGEYDLRYRIETDDIGSIPNIIVEGVDLKYEPNRTN